MIYQYCQKLGGITPEELRRAGLAHVERIDAEIDRFRRAIAAHLADRADASKRV
jgi:hypothetical protein